MGTYTEKEIKEIVEKGWVMFDIKYKPILKIGRILYDDKTDLYYHPGLGWGPYKKDMKDVYNLSDTERNIIKFAMLTDYTNQHTCNLYFFESYLEDDKEKWDMVGIYTHKKAQEAGQYCVSGAFKFQGPAILGMDIKPFLNHFMDKNGKLRAPMHCKSSNTNAFATEYEGIVDMILSTLDKSSTGRFLNSIDKVISINDILSKQVLISDGESLESFIWAVSSIYSKDYNFRNAASELHSDGFHSVVHELINNRGVVRKGDVSSNRLRKSVYLNKDLSFKDTLPLKMPLTALPSRVKRNITLRNTIELNSIHKHAKDDEEFTEFCKMLNMVTGKYVDVAIQIIYETTKKGTSLSDGMEKLKNSVEMKEKAR